MKIFCRSLVVLLCILVTAGCTDLYDPNASDGDDSSGSEYLSVYDLLVEKGDYSLFLEAVDLTGYTKRMQGSSLVTVFAPADDVFATYIAGKFGVLSVEEVPIDELTVLVGYHIVQYSWRPTDFLAFSMSGSAVVPEEGDGSCYKYLTYARDAVSRVTSSYGYSYDVFSLEKYLPVMSSRFMINRGLADPQYDYELLFPEVWWAGTDDQLYVGNAVVTESGLTCLNGYLYIIDNVAGSLNSIYDELHEDWAQEYELFKLLCERVDYFAYSSDYTADYAGFGDSLSLHYSWSAPVAGVDADEIPELASNWSYHSSDVYDRKLRYTVHCLVPTDRHLEPFILEQFADYYEELGNVSGDAETIISTLPRNVVYHLLRTFTYDKKDLIFPSELTTNGIYGNVGETFFINQEDIQDVVMCTNGVIYGLDTLIVSDVFNSVLSELMSNPDYQYYANAFTACDLYQQVASPSNDYTIFLRTDEVIETDAGCTVDLAEDPLAPGYGSYTFAGNMTATSDITLMLNNNMVYGAVDGVLARYDNGTITGDTTQIDEVRYRYYRTVGWNESGRYLYTYGGAIFDETDEELFIYETYEEGSNGTAYLVDRELSTATSTAASIVSDDEEFEIFYQLIADLGISGSTLGSSQVMMFIPSDSCIKDAVDMGYIPGVDYIVDSEIDGSDSIVYGDRNQSESFGNGTSLNSDLYYYVYYHFVSMTGNDLYTYLLPGLGDTGVPSEDPYSKEVLTKIPTTGRDTEAEYMTVSWDVSDPNVLTLTDNSGSQIKTSSTIPVKFTSNGVIYVLEDGCFDYSTMYKYR